MPETLPQLHNIPVRREAITACQIDGESVLYDPAHHTVHYLNATASTIWNCCDGLNTIEDITEKVAEAFELPEDIGDVHYQLHEDIESTLETMAADGLIDNREGSDA